MNFNRLFSILVFCLFAFVGQAQTPTKINPPHQIKEAGDSLQIFLTDELGRPIYQPVAEQIAPNDDNVLIEGENGLLYVPNQSSQCFEESFDSPFENAGYVQVTANSGQLPTDINLIDVFLNGNYQTYGSDWVLSNTNRVNLQNYSLSATDKVIVSFCTAVNVVGNADNDADPANELQNLTFDGENLGINNGNMVIIKKEEHGRKLYVSVDGDDNTAEIGNSHKPYQKIESAVADAQVGDVVWVFAGTYGDASNQVAYENLPTLGKNGVILHLEKGVEMHRFHLASFYNASGKGSYDLDFKITGNGSLFSCTNMLFSADTVVFRTYIECDYWQGGSFYSVINPAIADKGSSLYVKIKKYEIIPTSSSMPSPWDNSMFFISGGIGTIEDINGLINIDEVIINDQPTTPTYFSGATYQGHLFEVGCCNADQTLKNVNLTYNIGNIYVGDGYHFGDSGKLISFHHDNIFEDCNIIFNIGTINQKLTTNLSQLQSEITKPYQVYRKTPTLINFGSIFKNSQVNITVGNSVSDVTPIRIVNSGSGGPSINSTIEINGNFHTKEDGAIHIDQFGTVDTGITYNIGGTFISEKRSTVYSTNSTNLPFVNFSGVFKTMATGEPVFTIKHKLLLKDAVLINDVSYQAIESDVTVTVTANDLQMTGPLDPDITYQSTEMGLYNQQITFENSSIKLSNGGSIPILSYDSNTAALNALGVGQPWQGTGNNASFPRGAVFITYDPNTPAN